MIDAQTLQRFPLFDGLAAKDLEVLSQNLRPLHLEAGEMLITEGSATRAPLFLVEVGALEVTRRDAQGKSHRIVELHPPTVVGELEFLGPVHSSASVRATAEIRGMLLPRERFETLFEAGEPAAYHLALTIGRVVSQRLAETNMLLVKALADSPQRFEKVVTAQLDKEALARADAELEALLKR